MIKLVDVKKNYGNLEVLKGISLSIYDGDFISIVGKSGSGKTTLLKVIGLLEDFEGKYELNDEMIDKKKKGKITAYRKENFGYIYQSYFLDGHYSVYENIEMPLLIRNISKKDRLEKIQKISEKMEISDKLYVKSSKLSGGEQQRVAIARALVTDAKTILADEPCGALDSFNSKNILDILIQLNNEGKTIIMVTHDMEQAKLAKKIFRISDGAIIDESM